jgi:hypothetical protein
MLWQNACPECLTRNGKQSSTQVKTHFSLLNPLCLKPSCSPLSPQTTGEHSFEPLPAASCPSPLGQLCNDFLSTRSQLIGLFNRCNELGEDLCEAGRLPYRKEIAEVHSLVIEIKFELSKQPNPQLKRQLGEIIIQLAAKERKLEYAQWRLVGAFSEPEMERKSRGRSITL